MSGPEPYPVEEARRQYCFADFTLDLESGFLRRGSEEVALRPKPFAVLAYLVKHHGKLVAKKDLIEAVWPDTAVTDNALARCIVEIRRALGDESQQFIRTVARRGYVFAAPLAAPIDGLRSDSGEARAERLLNPAPALHAHSQRLNQRNLATVLAVAIGLFVAGYLAFKALPKRWDGDSLRAVALTSFPGVELYPSLSPGGEHVAFTWSGSQQNNFNIYVQTIGSASPVRLTDDIRADYNPAWSPDGRWVAFLRAGSTSLSMQPGSSELRVIPGLGGPERKLVDIRPRQVYFNPAYLAWCPDSACVVVADSPGEGRPDALFVVSLESGEKRQLTDPQPPVLDDTSPAVAPDGSSLVFRRATGYAAAELYLLPLGKGMVAGGMPTRLTSASLNATFPAWMPDGKEILFSSQGRIWKVAVSGESRPSPLPFVGEHGLMPVVSRARPGTPQRLVYARSFDDWSIWRVETTHPGAPASSRPTVAIASTGRNTSPQFSPDGRRVAFASNRSGVFEIWLSDPDGSNPVKLTSLGADATGTPRWSPDGRLIVFNSNPEGQYDIYLIPAGGGKSQRITSHPASDHVPSFSRDGKWIYFTSNRAGVNHIWKVSISGGEPVQVTQAPGYVAFESADGTDLYYTQSFRVPSALWRLPLAGGEPAKVVDGVVWRAFVPLKQGVYYISQLSDRAELQFRDFDTGRSTVVAGDLGDLKVGLTASPDGRTLLYSRADSSVGDLMVVDNFR